METSTQPLSDWLHQLGCPVDLSHTELLRLNSLKMKPVWRHLQNCIKPKFTVQTYKKNILINQLNSEEATIPNDFGKYKVGSVQELNLVKEIAFVEEQLANIRTKTEVLNNQIASSSSLYVTKKMEKKLLKDRISEVDDKSGLLELMSLSLTNLIERMDEETEPLSLLEVVPASVSYMEMKQNQATVVKCIQQLSNLEPLDADHFNDVIINTLTFLPTTIFTGVLFSSNLALKNLNSKLYKNFWCHEQNTSDVLNSSLRNLNAEILKYELSLSNSSKEIVKLSSELEINQSDLLKNFEEALGKNVGGEYTCESLTTSEIVNEYILRTQKNRKRLRTKVLLESLFTSSMETELLKSSVKFIGEENESMQKHVDSRIMHINGLLQEIYDNKEKVKCLRSKLLEKNSELASQFFFEHNSLNNVESCSDLMTTENLIKEELDLFQIMPLEAISRGWESHSNKFNDRSVQEILQSSSLKSVIFHSELKNVVLSLLERLCMLQNYDF